MDFFEALRERAHHRLVIEGGYDPTDGVAATIEALKEMMVVGKPGTGSLKHANYPNGTPNTLVLGDLTESTSSLTGVIMGHHGIDGEKVTTLILRKEPSLTKK